MIQNNLGYVRVCPVLKAPVSKDLSRLYHKCTGADCRFCEWRKHNTIDIGWEKLLDEPTMKLCGVDLTSYQIASRTVSYSTDHQHSESLWRWILFPSTWLRIRTRFNSNRVLHCCRAKIAWLLEVKVLINHACLHLSLWWKPLLSAQHLPPHIVHQKGKGLLKGQGDAETVSLRRLDGMWRYGQIGPHHRTTSYSLEKCHPALIFVN